jgi:hypothetical protein
MPLFYILCQTNVLLQKTLSAFAHSGLAGYIESGVSFNIADAKYLPRSVLPGMMDGIHALLLV